MEYEKGGHTVRLNSVDWRGMSALPESLRNDHSLRIAEVWEDTSYLLLYHLS